VESSVVSSWVRVSQAARLGARSDCLVVRWLLAAVYVLVYWFSDLFGVIRSTTYHHHLARRPLLRRGCLGYAVPEGQRHYV